MAILNASGHSSYLLLSCGNLARAVRPNTQRRLRHYNATPLDPHAALPQRQPIRVVILSVAYVVTDHLPSKYQSDRHVGHDYVARWRSGGAQCGSYPTGKPHLALDAGMPMLHPLLFAFYVS